LERKTDVREEGKIESGETMRAAGLHAIHTLLTSEAVLIRSTTPSPSSSPASLALIARISSRIAGVIAASKYVLVGYNIRREMVKEATKITPGRRAATVSPLDDPEWVAVSSMVLKAEVADVMDRLTEIGTFCFFFHFNLEDLAMKELTTREC
jgi:ATP phosphoribosyltransferase